MSAPSSLPVPSTPRAGAMAALLLAIGVGGLVTYKASSSLAALAKVQASGTLHSKVGWLATGELPAAVRPFAQSLNYFAWVAIALAFGVLIGALVHALVPARWLAGTLGAGGARGQLFAALAGAPLMLCSCCVAPVFDGVYGRTRKLGPALGLMFAAPGLNPMALVLTFLLFPVGHGLARLGLTLAIVLAGAWGLGRSFGDAANPDACVAEAGEASVPTAFLASLRKVALRSLPAIAVGVLASAVLGQVVLADAASVAGGPLPVILLVGAFAVLIALPTFGEIPLALALQVAGAPEGAVLALLVAGPVVNLPSLLTVRRSVSTRAAVACGLAVFAVASGGGLLFQLVA